MKSSKTVKVITLVGVLSALAYILYILEIPLFIYFPTWLKIDLSDIPAILGGIALGPVAGIAIELIKNIIHGLTLATPSYSGEIANFVAGSGLLVPIALVLRKSRKNSFLPYVIGAVIMTVVANIMNYFVTLPLYGFTPESKMPTIISYLVPFNLLKAALISVVIAVLYSKMKRVILKYSL